jgi:hypothetical protein
MKTFTLKGIQTIHYGDSFTFFFFYLLYTLESTEHEKVRRINSGTKYLDKCLQNSENGEIFQGAAVV